MLGSANRCLEAIANEKGLAASQHIQCLLLTEIISLIGAQCHAEQCLDIELHLCGKRDVLLLQKLRCHSVRCGDFQEVHSQVDVGMRVLSNALPLGLLHYELLPICDSVVINCIWWPSGPNSIPCHCCHCACNHKSSG